MNPNPLTIRRATPDDIPTLRQLAHRIWHDYYPAVISREQIAYMLERMYSPEQIRRELDDGVLWELLLRAGEPVGFISCAHEPAAARVKLNKLYLLTELHGRGLGQQALEHVKRAARQLGASQVYLTVNKGNHRAVRAYQRAGFRVAEAVVTDIGGGFVMDDYVMTFGLGAPPEPGARPSLAPGD